MKKSAQHPAGRAKPAHEVGADKTTNARVFLPPLKPRPRLFYALLAGVGVWVAILLTLYFTTVHSAPTYDKAQSQTRATDNLDSD